MEDVSVIGLLFRLVISLGAVLGLMALAGRGLRRRAGFGVGRPSTDAVIDVVARRGLSRTASIAVVRAGGRDLVLGVTDASVTLLAEAEAGDLVAVAPTAPGSSPAPSAAPGSWQSLLEAIRERTVRRD